MTTLDCDAVRSDLPAFALGALPDERMVEIRAHLAGCDAHDEALELLSTAGSLAVAAEEAEPPAALRERIRAALGPRRATRVESAATRPGFTWSQFGRVGGRWGNLAAALAIVTAGLLAWNIVLQVDDDATVTVAFRGSVGAGSVVVLEEENVAVVLLAELPEAAAGRTYQLWTIRDGAATSQGTFAVDSGGGARVVIPLFEPSGLSVAVTEEPAGGSAQPSSDPLLVARLRA